jgi:probable HAF family extracellular repeat protein
MYRSCYGVLVCALALGSGTVVQAATPQFALVDLGPTTIAGSGLPWQAVQPTPAPDFPSTASAQGSACFGDAVNQIDAEYGSEAVGATCLTTPNLHAARWTSINTTPTLTDLGVLPGAKGGAGTGGPTSIAMGFNNVGDIVGWSDTQYTAANSNQEAHHAFLYNSGVMKDLGSIAGPEYFSAAESVNDSHEVVGSTSTISSVNGSVLSRAFLYTNGTMYNLTFYLVGGPTALLSDALWIDCQGNIAAVGTPASGGSTHSYLLVRQAAARANCPQ